MVQTPVAISAVLTENFSSLPSLCTRYVPGELITNKATLTKLLLNPKAFVLLGWCDEPKLKYVPEDT